MNLTHHTGAARSLRHFNQRRRREVEIRENVRFSKQHTRSPHRIFISNRYLRGLVVVIIIGPPTVVAAVHRLIRADRFHTATFRCAREIECVFPRSSRCGESPPPRLIFGRFSSRSSLSRSPFGRSFGCRGRPRRDFRRRQLSDEKFLSSTTRSERLRQRFGARDRRFGKSISGWHGVIESNFPITTNNEKNREKDRAVLPLLEK